MRSFLAMSTNCNGADPRPLSPRSRQKWVSHVCSPAQTISRQKSFSPVKPFLRQKPPSFKTSKMESPTNYHSLVSCGIYNKQSGEILSSGVVETEMGKVLFLRVSQ